MENNIQKIQIIEAVNAIVNAADNKDWEACASCFTTEVLLDHDAHLNNQPVILSNRQLIEDWQQAFADMSFTWHQVTNHAVTVNGDLAICYSKVMGLHVGKTNNSYYSTWGNYKHELSLTSNGWKVSSIQYKQLFDQGNSSLFRN
jgi:ketosteroid isomerase-like protein